ncbi:MAG: DNA primase [Candidatus Ozemobacter sibiricus]|jgi:DNA primase|uniref:DNA primase n=1 Tax=Candidatus Ozemobacter sibiricus TaxID=2268124 RepID=A0A367ZUS4_9BACT|nr:MAG: DNA primase [Candidatus Ozemobacter sibiricus]
MPQGTTTFLPTIASDIKVEIRARTDIVQLVGEYVRLIPSGRTYKGLCPFHQEKTPSFYVVPQKQIFHCFGCGKGGDVFAFLMEIEKLTFPEAVRLLARRLGIEMPAPVDPETDRKAPFFAMLEQAAKFYASQLYQAQTGAPAREYLKTREIDWDTARAFQLGFAPPTGDALARRFAKDADSTVLLEKVGLIRAHGSGAGHYDTFRNRLMIPILDTHGRVIGFGGRILGKSDEPKYLNSPESEVFNKRRVLFNFKAALPQIRRQNAAIVVEGFLDVISLVQRGVPNVVATLGTSITSEQLQLLARNAQTLYLSYDADEAGQRATLRAISLQRDTPLNARILSFPDPKDDPDSFIRREGVEKFLERLKASQDIYTFLVEMRTRGLPRPLEVHVKERLVREFRDYIKAIESPIARSETIKTMARLLDLDVHLLEAQFAQDRPTSSAPPAEKPASAVPPAQRRREEWVLKHLLDHPDEFPRTRSLLSSADFTDPDLGKIFSLIRDTVERGEGPLQPADLLGALDEPRLASRLSGLIIALEEAPPEPFMECVKGMAIHRLKRESQDLQAQIAKAEKAGDQARLADLQRQQFELRRKIDLLGRNV